MSNSFTCLMDITKDLDDFIKRLKVSEKLIIVEGLKDKRALESFGIKNIMTLKKPLYKVIEEASEKSKDIIILTDLDSKGRELFGRLNSGLQRHGVRVDKTFREFLFRNTKLRQIEGITTYIKNLYKN